jgi:hypothetical protein
VQREADDTRLFTPADLLTLAAELRISLGSGTSFFLSPTDKILDYVKSKATAIFLEKTGL